ncbi:MAG: hypothetical protein CMC08_00005 [Flavobacteriaceae bacterium]|mgnify:CR=1 FL=1|nr:hypothetical protein [Flavobacteriaceae bacterium]
MKKSLFLLFTLFTFSVGAQTTKLEVPRIAVKVPLGETVNFEEVAITFNEVLEDSRCPKYVDCIWAGRVRVVVEISEENGKTEQKELLLGAVKQGETVQSEVFSKMGYRVELMRVTPYPGSEEADSGQPYALLLAETNKQD